MPGRVARGARKEALASTFRSWDNACGLLSWDAVEQLVPSPSDRADILASRATSASFRPDVIETTPGREERGPRTLPLRAASSDWLSLDKLIESGTFRSETTTFGCVDSEFEILSPADVTETIPGRVALGARKEPLASAFRHWGDACGFSSWESVEHFVSSPSDRADILASKAITASLRPGDTEPVPSSVVRGARRLPWMAAPPAWQFSYKLAR